MNKLPVTKLIIILVTHSSLQVTDLLCRSGETSEWSPSHFWSWSAHREPLGHNYMKKKTDGEPWMSRHESVKGDIPDAFDLSKENPDRFVDFCGCSVMLTEVNLKQQFTQKWKLSHYLLMESQVNVFSPLNISGASQLNSSKQLK